MRKLYILSDSVKFDIDGIELDFSKLAEHLRTMEEQPRRKRDILSDIGSAVVVKVVVFVDTAFVNK